MVSDPLLVFPTRWSSNTRLRPLRHGWLARNLRDRHLYHQEFPGAQAPSNGKHDGGFPVLPRWHAPNQNLQLFRPPQNLLRHTSHALRTTTTYPQRALLFPDGSQWNGGVGEEDLGEWWRWWGSFGIWCFRGELMSAGFGGWRAYGGGEVDGCVLGAALVPFATKWPNHTKWWPPNEYLVTDDTKAWMCWWVSICQ